MNDETQAQGLGSGVSVAAEDSTVQAAADFFAQLAKCSGPEDPTFRAASLLADAWQPALDRSYRLGYENGYAAGFYESERDSAAAWAKAARPIRDVLSRPTRDELLERRGESA